MQTSIRFACKRREGICTSTFWWGAGSSGKLLTELPRRLGGSKRRQRLLLVGLDRDSQFAADVGLITGYNGISATVHGEFLWAVDAVHSAEGVDRELWDSVEAEVDETGG